MPTGLEIIPKRCKPWFGEPGWEGLGRLLRLSAEPARRHKCPECKEVIECHLCSIGNDHDLHLNLNTRFICLECSIASGIDTVFVQDKCVLTISYKIYDYSTGQVVWRHQGYILGIQTEGRVGHRRHPNALRRGRVTRKT